ncbi:hypothetical protein WJX75_007332 [Coccomyxa subellipsoidea]|uniref:Uncharacterized protein n=1 Tax=Coccomyxa subellipsoidea TaxID=248742 RepID=A0ABR2YTY6_9CHLO
MREKKLCTAYGNFACKGDYWDEGEEGGAEDARGEATEAINMTSAYDKLLKEDTPGVRYRRVRSLVKIVRVEHLLLMHDTQDRKAWLSQDPPPLVDLWNSPDLSSDVGTNCIAIIAEWNQFAAATGIRYGLIFTHMWLWALKSDGANNVRISPAFSYCAHDPSILEVGLL